MRPPPLVLLRLADGTRKPIDPADVYLLEATDGDTAVRLRSRTPERDVRKLGELEPLFARHGFVRVHDRWLVNPRRILLARPRSGREGWELVMAPPVNAVVPVARGRVGELWGAFEPQDATAGGSP